MNSLPEPETATLESSAFARLKRVKRDLVLDLFLQRGMFWKLIKNLREKRKITPTVELPSQPEPNKPWQRLMNLLPSCAPAPPEYNPFDHSLPQDLREKAEAQYEARYTFKFAWWKDLDDIMRRVVPRQCQGDENYKLQELQDWREFFAACTLYDPPDKDLPTFAAYHDPQAYMTSNPDETSWYEQKRFVFMTLPPVKFLQDPLAAEENEARHWEHIIEEIGKRHLEPLGLDIHEMLIDVVRNCPEIFEEKMQRDRENKRRCYIEVDEHTRRDEVDGAFRMLVSQRGNKNPGGRPPIDDLTAVQCAVLYDDHNGIDPEDRRFRLWTYKKLATKFSDLGVKNERSAEEHVKRGRELRENFRNP